MTKKKISEWFDEELATIIGNKIRDVYPSFDTKGYYTQIKKECPQKTYSQRVLLHAQTLQKFLPKPYTQALKIVVAILGPENPNETGMFTEYYWVLPLAKFVEVYGLNHVDISLDAIEEITKRSTGEYAIRPFIVTYPRIVLERCEMWAKSDNFHLRRLASEGLRPKLPWAKKLTLFIENPTPVFRILSLLLDDEILFVRRSVANCLADYLKVHPTYAWPFVKKLQTSKKPERKWIYTHATRAVKN
ncbi:MAG: DNA alkylation repair protein [Candidatus Woesearchaeota archaeon]